MSNWKTTLTGVLAIVVAIGGGALAFLKTGVLPDFTAILAAVAAGWGLIWAKDHDTKS